MKCPSCGYNSFDHLELCKKCGSPLGAETESQTTGDKRRKNPREHSDKDSAEAVTGELFLDIPIRDRELQTRPESKGGGARRKRTYDVLTDPRAESYELFPVSKESNAERNAGDKSRARETPPGPEPVLESRHADSFHIIDNDSDIFEPEGLTEPYGREADVYSLAGFIRRAMALVIDIVLVSLIALFACFAGLFVLYGFDLGSYDTGATLMPLYLTLFLLSSTYFIFFHAYGGMTVGKKILGIKLINRYGEGIGIWDAFIRWIGYYISGAFLCAGFLWSLVDSESQAWHDKIAGTYVVKD